MTRRTPGPDYTFKGAIHSFLEAFSGCLTVLTVVMAVMILASVAVLILIWWQYPGSRWWLGLGGSVFLVAVAVASWLQLGQVESD